MEARRTGGEADEEAEADGEEAEYGDVADYVGGASNEGEGGKEHMDPEAVMRLAAQSKAARGEEESGEESGEEGGAEAGRAGRSGER